MSWHLAGVFVYFLGWAIGFAAGWICGQQAMRNHAHKMVEFHDRVVGKDKS